MGYRKAAMGFGMAFGAFMFSFRSADAGPSYEIDQKILGAQVIAEVEISVLPMSLGWKASVASAKKGKVIRIIFREGGEKPTDEKLLLFPFSNGAPCWKSLSGETSIRTLVFLPQDTVAGVEEDLGAYTSLNADYSLVIEAATTVSRWRSEPRRDEVDQNKVKIVSTTSNPYLQYVGAQFLKQSTQENIPSMVQILTRLAPKVGYPAAECGRRKGRGLTRR